MSRTVTHPYGECVNITNRVSLAIAAEPAPTTIRVPIVLALHANLVRLTVLVHTRTPLVAAAQAAQGAATYARLSDDGLSIPDQLASSRKYAEDRGWQVAGEFVDEHKSAFRKVGARDLRLCSQRLTPGRSTRSSRGTKIA